MLPLPDEFLAASFYADRLAAADRARLVRRGRAARPRTRPGGRPLIGLGHALVRLGRQLECLGGECAPARAGDVAPAVGR
jgi:hypothetical protein